MGLNEAFFPHFPFSLPLPYQPSWRYRHNKYGHFPSSSYSSRGQWVKGNKLPFLDSFLIPVTLSSMRTYDSAAKTSLSLHSIFSSRFPTLVRSLVISTQMALCWCHAVLRVHGMLTTLGVILRCVACLMCLAIVGLISTIILTGTIRFICTGPK